MDDATIYAVVNAIKWPVGVLIAVLGYFLRDAHVSMKQDIKKKADKDALDDAFRAYREDMKAMEERHSESMKAMDSRHKEETARMERYYEVKLVGVVAQFSERMNSMEKNLLDRMDLIRTTMSKG